VLRALLLTGFLVGAGAASAVEAPDLARSMAFRDLDSIEAWLSELEGRPEADSVEAWRARVALARVQAPESAASTVTRARELHPRDALLLLQQAAIEREAMDESDGRFERMREARAIGRKLDQVLELDPMQVEGLVAAIEYHRDAPRIAGGREERLPSLQARLAELAPARAAFVAFQSAERAGDLAEALEALDSAIALDSTNPPAWRVRRAALQAQLGDLGEAVAELEAAVAEHPAYAPAWFELGRWIAKSDADLELDPERGIEALERFVLMNRWPDDPPLAGALVHLATLKTRAGDAEGAARALDQARILDPSLLGEQDSSTENDSRN
jgi:tetratricopeptide (TPR) repeat protein